MAISSKSSISVISGVAITGINNYILTLADNYVKSILNRDFSAIATDEQYFDVESRNRFFLNYDGIREFPLRFVPVTEFTSLIKFPDSDDPETLTINDDYFFYMDKGIFQFEDNFEIPMGIRVLKATYKYGFSTAPADVIDFANFYGAFLVESNASAAKNDDGAVLKEVEIGRYREAYMDVSAHLKGKYSSYLKTTEELLIAKYKIWL